MAHIRVSPAMRCMTGESPDSREGTTEPYALVGGVGHWCSAGWCRYCCRRTVIGRRTVGFALTLLLSVRGWRGIDTLVPFFAPGTCHVLRIGTRRNCCRSGCCGIEVGVHELLPCRFRDVHAVPCRAVHAVDGLVVERVVAGSARCRRPRMSRPAARSRP